MLASGPRSLESLREAAAQDSALIPYVLRLEQVRHLIETKCPEAVSWAAAYGRFLDLFETNKKRKSKTIRDGLEILIVTPLKSLYKAHEVLGEKVFGPILFESGNFQRYLVLTTSEFRAVKAAGELNRFVTPEAVTIYGSPRSRI